MARSRSRVCSCHRGVLNFGDFSWVLIDIVECDVDDVTVLGGGLSSQLVRDDAAVAEHFDV